MLTCDGRRICSVVKLSPLSPPPSPLSLFGSSELITDNQIECGQLKADLKDKVMYTLLRKHRHQTKKSNLRSLADIGKTVSSASRLFSNQENGNTDASLVQSSLLNLYKNKSAVKGQFRFLWPQSDERISIHDDFQHITHTLFCPKPVMQTCECLFAN